MHLVPPVVPRLFWLLCFLGLRLISPAAATPALSPVVAISSGQIQGARLPDGHGFVFRGIPFAQPPVGEFRWREPQPVIAWSDVRDAIKCGPPAAQASIGWNERFATASSEDCLYLDVWTPTESGQARKPVMVWLHGGANVGGSGGADNLYDGQPLISHDVVLVVIEYRLGIFGFFAHPDLTKESPHHSSGNYGLLDQIAALQWVHDNITRFGGDPNNVTLFGQSAGSIDALALMTTPLTHGLFQRVIAESGPLFPTSFRTLDEREKTGMRAIEQLPVSSEKNLAYLRSLSVEELFKIKTGGAAPNIDGWVLPVDPAVQIASGKANPLPLLIGTNAIEFPFSGSVDELKNDIQSVFHGLAPKVLAQYGLNQGSLPPAPDPVYGDLADQWGSVFFQCISIIQGGRHAAAGNPVWEYEFARAIPPRPKVGHSGDLPYVFGNLYAKGDQAGDFQAADHRLSANIQAYWTNFAKTGNPNGSGLPLWPTYDDKTRKFMRFTTAAEIQVGENQRGPICDLFRELLNTPPPGR
jgi:para-nitrobenzyl esterase